MDEPALNLAAYRSLARGLPRGTLALFDRELRFVLVDGELLTRAGHSEAQLVGKTIAEAFPPPIAAAFIPSYQRALAGETIDETLTFDQTVLKHLARPVRNDQGEVVAVIAMTQDATEQVRAEQALRLSERRFRSLVESGSEAMLHLDQDGRIIFQDVSAARVWGWTPADVMGQGIEAFIHEDSRAEVAAAIAAMRQQPHTRAAVTLRIRHRDGGWRWSDARLSNLLHEPAIGALVIFFHDITPHRMALEALRVVAETTAATLGEDYLRSLVRGLAAVLGVAQVLIAARSADGALRVRAAEGRAAELGAIDPTIGVVARMLAGEEVEHAEAAGTSAPDPLLAATGARSMIGLPLRGAEQSVLGVLAVLDVPPLHEPDQWRPILRLFAMRAASEVARLEREQALRVSEELNRQLLEALPNGLIQVDRHVAIIRANPLAIAFLGLEVGPDGTYHGDFADRLTNEDGTRCDPTDSPLARTLATGLADGPRTLGLRTPDGSSWGVFSAVPLRGTAGVGGGALMCFLDISERKRLEDQLRHSQKMDAIGKLAGGVAHDFNNLLTVILGRSELLLDRLPPEDRTREDIKLFHRTASRAAGLTRQLLAISRQQVTDARVVDLNHAVTHMGDLLRGLLGEHIELRTVLEPRLGRILADPSHIEQVILNLCVNARDAMANGGVLTIQTANAEVKQATAELKPGRYVLLVVKDTGTGIDPRIQSRIFEPFFTTKTSGKGTGLGLSTVFGIARQHGGSVMVRSEVGKGSAFFVYLPRSDQQPDPSGPQPLLSDQGRGTETILLVEDHDELRIMLEGLLTGRGYHLITARDGREALALVEASNERVDLVVTDLVMPVMGGRELARRLAQRTPAITRVLYVTGYSEEPVTAEAGSQVLQKPFSSDTLTRAVRELLDRR